MNSYDLNQYLTIGLGVNLEFKIWNGWIFVHSFLEEIHVTVSLVPIRVCQSWFVYKFSKDTLIFEEEMALKH